MSLSWNIPSWAKPSQAWALRFLSWNRVVYMSVDKKLFLAQNLFFLGFNSHFKENTVLPQRKPKKVVNKVPKFQKTTYEQNWSFPVCALLRLEAGCPQDKHVRDWKTSLLLVAFWNFRVRVFKYINSKYLLSDLFRCVLYLISKNGTFRRC